MKKRISTFLDNQLSTPLFTYREIFKMLFPLILDMLFINVIIMLTTSMISSSGEASVAAVSLISPVSTLVLSLLNAIAAGGTVVVAQYKGKGTHDKILEASGHTLSVTLAAAVLVCVPLMLFASPVVQLLFGGAEPEVLSKASVYLAGVSFSIIIYSFYSGIFAIFRGLGETKICLNLTMVINLSYFVLSFVFINWLKMDIIGTVIALVLARLLGSGASLYYLFMRKKRIIRLSLSHFLHFNKALFHSILKISIPFGSEQFFFYGGSILVQKYMVTLGTEAMAANAIASSLFPLIYAAPLAVGNLATTVIGQCVGAGRKDDAKRYGMKLVHMGTALSLVSMVVFLPFMTFLMSFYNPSASAGPLVIRLMWLALLPMPFFYSLSNVMPYVLRSAGDAVYSSVVSLLTMWIIRVGAGYVAAIPLGFGVEGIWVCMAFEWVVRSLLFYIRYKRNKWLSKNTIQD